jgi:integrase
MLAVLTNKENDHAGQRSLSRTRTQAWCVEQGQADRRQAAAAPKARLVDSHQAPVADRKRDLAMFNLAIDSKLRGCDVVALKVEDIAPHGYAVERAMVRQKKTGVPVRFEVTEQTRQAVDDYIRAADRKPGDFLFAAPRRPGRGLSTRQYARLVGDWIRGIGLDPCMFGTHSLRRTKATLIYRRTGNLRAVQLLLGHSKIESTVRYLGIEVDDALAVAEQIDV